VAGRMNPAKLKTKVLSEARQVLEKPRASQFSFLPPAKAAREQER